MLEANPILSLKNNNNLEAAGGYLIIFLNYE